MLVQQGFPKWATPPEPHKFVFPDSEALKPPPTDMETILFAVVGIESPLMPAG